jgi:hypothetical protein
MATVQFPKSASAKMLQKAASDRNSTSTSNLQWASLALDYVKRSVTVGLQKRIADELKSFGMAYVCVAAIRSVESADLSSLGPKAYIHRIAEILKTTGCGNCGEQSALAFTYLEENSVKPLDWMCRANGDHAFVVIGRDKHVSEANYNDWGKDAVVCDPWKGEAFPASETGKKNGQSWVYESGYSI